MGIKDLYNNQDFINHLIKECKKVYYSENNWVVKNNYEFDDFVNEVNIYIIKYWETRDKSYDVRYWVHLIVGSVMKDLYKSTRTDKRGELSDCNLYRLDSVINEHNEHDNITVELKSKNYFDLHEYIKFTLNMIDNKIDKNICELYLLGYTTIKISEMVNLTPRQVRYKINNKYNKLFQESYLEYKANII